MTWLARLFRRGTLERRLDAELRDHLDRLAADHRRRGRTAAEAERLARLELGGLDQTKEACRDARGTRWVHEVAQDARYGARLLARSPAFTLVVVLSLALGIGANTAIFALVDGLLLRSLPVRDPEQLVLLERGSWTNPIWEQLRDRHGAWAAAAFAWSDDRFDLAAGGEAVAVDGIWASGDLFTVLGVEPVIGRLLVPADDRRGGGADGPVAVISHRLWQQRYHGTPDVLGRAITLNRVPFTIVGVSPPGFAGPTVGRRFDVAVPLGAVDLVRVGQESRLDGRSTWWLEIMFRLRPGDTLERATTQLRAIQAQVRDATLPTGWPQDAMDQYLREGFTLAPAATGRSDLRAAYRLPLLVLMGGVALVLLVACANIANLLLARANARRHELSARLALGASRGRLARQLLTESLLFAVPGALLGTWFAAAASRFLVDQISTPRQQVSLDLGPNWRVLAFTTAVAVTTSLLFGIAPAWRATRVDPHDALGEHGRGTSGDRRHTVSNSLVVAQVALSLVLVVGAALFVRTFTALASLDLGLDTSRVLTIGLDASKSEGDEGTRRRVFERIADTAAAVPGVRRSAVSLIPPMSGRGWNNMFSVDDEPPPPSFDRERLAFINAVTPAFFDAYGIALRAGRAFDDRDRAGGPQVVIVNEAFARRFFTGRAPVGRTVSPGARPGRPVERWEVVGIVRDAAYRSLRPPFPPTVYRPLSQLSADEVFPNASLAVRASSELSPALVKQVVGEVARVDPTLSLTVLPFDRQVRSLMTRERLVAVLSAGFGGLALLLACVGLYGVTAYAVSRRRIEIGIRMALGADAGRVLRLVLGRAALLAALGIALGGGLSLWAARYVGPLLFGLEARDPATLAGATLALATTAGLAAWLPARRAARIDPARVLREG